MAQRFPRSVVDHYRTFHGVEPSHARIKRLWAPGGLVLLGACVDVGYGIIDPKSKKEKGVWYVHDHKAGVRIYRRAATQERPTRTYKSFPLYHMVLGSWLGATFVGPDGEEQEIRGNKRIKLCTPDKKKLVAIHDTRGVIYVIQGGALKITDWIRN